MSATEVGTAMNAAKQVWVPCGPWVRRLAGLLFVLSVLGAARAPAQSSLAEVVAATQPKIVKIFGAGGLRGLEAYQSGFFISDQGHILTVWSYVLDTDALSVHLHDGRRLSAELVGMDPRAEIAVLKVAAADTPHFTLEEAVVLEPGAKVLAFSNLFGIALGNEPASVLHGVVSAYTDLAARRGVFEASYRGPVYLVDAMVNNPGAAGGALCDRQGRLAGLVGKELRSSLTNIWINYALPVGELKPTIDEILAGKYRPAPPPDPKARPKQPHSLAELGIRLVPDFLPRTPPFIESVTSASPAARAGLKPDDLILFVSGRLVPSCKAVEDELARIDRLDSVRLTVQRGQTLLEVELAAPR